VKRNGRRCYTNAITSRHFDIIAYPSLQRERREFECNVVMLKRPKRHTSVNPGCQVGIARMSHRALSQLDQCQKRLSVFGNANSLKTLAVGTDCHPACSTSIRDAGRRDAPPRGDPFHWHCRWQIASGIQRTRRSQQT